MSEQDDKTLMEYIKKRLQDVTIQDMIDKMLNDVPDKEWRVVELTIRKRGENWEVAEGPTFGPFLTLPEQIPMLAEAKEERDGKNNTT